DDRADLAARDGDRDVVEGGESAEALRQILGTEDDVAGGRAPAVAGRARHGRHGGVRHAFGKVQAGGTTGFSRATTSRRRCLLSLMSKMNCRRKAWWSSLRRTLSPCGKSSLSLTSMPSSASMSFIVCLSNSLSPAARPWNPDFWMPSFRKFM